MNILIIGDVVGSPGRGILNKQLAKIKKDYHIDIVIANGENSAHGRGITKKTMAEMQRAGVDIITSGNHIWDQKEIFDFIDDEPFLTRPANYPKGSPGKGYCIYPYKAKNIGVINLSGRTYMPPVDCPFQKIEEILREIKDKCDIIILDFHAEATSEKIAMGYYLDGRITCQVGTHTHVATSDYRILPKGTAYITDLGMTGPIHSSLGVNVQDAIDKFVTGMPVRFQIADGPNMINGIILSLDDKNKVEKIERFYIEEE